MGMYAGRRVKSRTVTEKIITEGKNMSRKLALMGIVLLVCLTIQPVVYAQSLTAAATGEAGLSFRYVKTICDRGCF